LLDVPSPLRLTLATDLVQEAVAGGQRVLVLTNSADRLIEVLVGRIDGQIGRALAANESIEQHPESATRTAEALAQREQAVIRERSEQLNQKEATLWASLDMLMAQATAVVEASEEFRRLSAHHQAQVVKAAEHQARRLAVEKELADLRSHANSPPGFFRRLFGGAKRVNGQLQIDTLEAQLRELGTVPDPNREFQAERDRLIAHEVSLHRVHLDSELARIEHERTTLHEGNESLAQLDARPPTLTVEAKERVRVVVGPVAALGRDPFLVSSHPEASPRFDRIVVLDADELTEDDFAPAAGWAPAWVFVGTPDPITPPTYRNGTYPTRPRSSLFGRFWSGLRDPGWDEEGDRILVRLTAGSPDHRTELVCESLVDRPDIEVRFDLNNGEPTLAEVLFPRGMTLAEAKAFLAVEAGEARWSCLGPAVWQDSASVITCGWPLVECLDEGTWVDLVPGVRERIVGTGQATLTAAITFDPAGWTRDSAAEWLQARFSSHARTAAVR
jgi:hypothetical protein